MEERKFKEEENHRRFLIREHIKDSGQSEHIRRIQQIKYDQETGKYPRDLVDNNLHECIISKSSPLREFVLEKYGFNQ